MASAPTDWQAYIRANPDLGAAGITTPEQAQQHWNQYGQYENRQTGAAAAPAAVDFQAKAAANPGGLWVGGQYATPQEVKDFYASGGNDNQRLQELGVTDLSQIHTLANQARDISGNNPMGGQAGLEKYFQQYQKESPNGAFVNDYSGWLNNISPTQKTAIINGSYTGVANAGGKDFDFGGIYGPGTASYGTSNYGSGLGANGISGQWAAPATAGALSTSGGTPITQRPTPGSSLVQQAPAQAAPVYGNGALTQAAVQGPNPYQHIYRADQQGPWMNFHSDGQPSAAPLEFHAQPASSRYASGEVAPPQDQVGALTRAGV